MRTFTVDPEAAYAVVVRTHYILHEMHCLHGGVSGRACEGNAPGLREDIG